MPRKRGLRSLGSRVQKSKKATVWVPSRLLAWPVPRQKQLTLHRLARILITNRHCRTLIVDVDCSTDGNHRPNFASQAQGSLQTPLFPLQSRAPGATLARTSSSPDVILYRPYRLYLDIVIWTSCCVNSRKILIDEMFYALQLRVDTDTNGQQAVPTRSSPGA